MPPSPPEMLLAVLGFSVHSTVCSWVPLPGYFTERPCTLASIGIWVCSCRCSCSHPCLSRDVVLGLSQRSFRCIGISTRDGTRQISFPLEASSNQSGISPGSHPHLERHAERLPSTVIVAEQQAPPDCLRIETQFRTFAAEDRSIPFSLPGFAFLSGRCFLRPDPPSFQPEDFPSFRS